MVTGRAGLRTRACSRKGRGAEGPRELGRRSDAAVRARGEDPARADRQPLARCCAMRGESAGRSQGCRGQLVGQRSGWSTWSVASEGAEAIAHGSSDVVGRLLPVVVSAHPRDRGRRCVRWRWAGRRTTPRPGCARTGGRGAGRAHPAPLRAAAPTLRATGRRRERGIAGWPLVASTRAPAAAGYLARAACTCGPSRRPCGCGPSRGPRGCGA